VTIPPSTGRRKTRFVRDEPPPDDVAILVRATGSNIDGVVDDMVRDARYSGDTYAIELSDGGRDILFGVSMFALSSGRPVSDVLDRFLTSPSYLAVTVASLRTAGFEVLPTGTNPAHFDVQLVNGVADSQGSSVVTDEELRGRAEELVRLAGPLETNAAYAGEEALPEEP